VPRTGAIPVRSTTPFNADGEHACPVCAGSNRAYRPRYVEMACWIDDE
jgi:hypothetical protein